MIKLKSLLLESSTNTKIERIGQDPNENYPDIPVDWDAKDIQILDKWNIKTVRNYDGKPKTFTAIYPAILDVNDLYPKLAEEDPEYNDDGITGGYDWEEFRMRTKGFPPILVKRTTLGHIVMMDGNHRVTWAENSNYKTIAAWVVDEFLQKVIDSRKKI